MGWLSGRGKSESLSVEELLAMSDKDIDRALKGGKKDVPYRSAKELRQAAKKDRRAVMGEKGMGALLAGLGELRASKGKSRGTGNQNYGNVPLKDRMHPAAYKALLDKEARRQGLL
jgi:hypothetical protein